MEKRYKNNWTDEELIRANEQEVLLFRDEEQVIKSLYDYCCFWYKDEKVSLNKVLIFVKDYFKGVI